MRCAALRPRVREKVAAVWKLELGSGQAAFARRVSTGVLAGA